MKKILLIGMLLTMFLGIQAQTGKKMLVTYFSWSGSTKALAEEIQRQTNADIYRIEPLVPYTDDYQELAYQISNKEKEENARPVLKDTLSTLNDYDIIFVGCPVWWFDAPMIIHSFLECKYYNFSGKTIVPFCTYASGASGTLTDIVNATPNSEHLTGLGTRGSQSNYSRVVSEWLDRIGISDIVSGVENVNAIGNRQPAVVYDIDGVRMPAVGGSLKGVHIVNGRKVVF